jgi:translation initiation factor IF-3
MSHKIELVPDFDHCIETVAKKKYAELTQILLYCKADNDEIEEKLETLRLFLGTADFRKLRSESEKQLIEGESVRFSVWIKGRALKYEMNII